MDRIDPALPPDAGVLFICTGNYYRSRYAEARFLTWSRHRGFPLRVASRGLAIDVEQKTNKGPMSPYAVDRLRDHGIDPDPFLWMPRDLTEDDLSSHALRIAVDRDEHAPLVERRFPTWVDRLDYWDVADGVPTERRHPLAEIDHHLESLFDRVVRSLVA